MLNPLPYTLMTNDGRGHYKKILILKFADDTAVVGLITLRDETAYRLEVEDLIWWCRDKNLNIQKTKEMVVDFRRTGPFIPPAPLPFT